MAHEQFVLTQGLGQQLEFAFRRNGWDTDQVHQLCAGNVLGLARQFMLSQHEPPEALKGTLKRNPLFNPWKTITIGKRGSAEEMILALEREKYPVWDTSKKILRHPDVVFATEETEIKLAKLTMEDLGLSEYLHYSIMLRRIKHMGFQVCTPEMAAELRLMFDDQEDMVILAVMEPIDGEVLDYYLANEKGELELSAQAISECPNFTPGCLEFVCVIP